MYHMGVGRADHAARVCACDGRCALRPTRLLQMLRMRVEHVCIKRLLQVHLRRQFEQLCVLPTRFNWCFDWDLAGTRWQVCPFHALNRFLRLVFR
jgi:hypothetical protein